MIGLHTDSLACLLVLLLVSMTWSERVMCAFSSSLERWTAGVSCAQVRSVHQWQCIGRRSALDSARPRACARSRAPPGARPVQETTYRCSTRAGEPSNDRQTADHQRGRIVAGISQCIRDPSSGTARTAATDRTRCTKYVSIRAGRACPIRPIAATIGELSCHGYGRNGDR